MELVTDQRLSLSQQEVGISVSDDSDESLGEDSDSDNFSVEFEVESIDSDAYSENDEASVAGEDEVSESASIPQMKVQSSCLPQTPGLTTPISLSLSLPVQVYEVTIFGAEDEDSFDEDTEITEAVCPVEILFSFLIIYRFQFSNCLCM